MWSSSFSHKQSTTSLSMNSKVPKSSVTETSSSSSSSQQQQEQQQPPPTTPERKIRRVQALLSALSFEPRRGSSSRQPKNNNTSNKSNLEEENDNNMTTSKPEEETTQPEMGGDVVVTTSSSRSDDDDDNNKHESLLHVHVNHILHGTMDPEGHNVELIFYDAQETGDGDHEDEFKVDFRRESVVIPSCIAHGANSNEGLSEELELIHGYYANNEQQHELQVDNEQQDDDEDHELLHDETTTTSPKKTQQQEQSYHHVACRGSQIPLPPPPPQELPLRFLRAGKGNPEEGVRRYEATLKWRKENHMDTILREANPHFDLIKQHYPHYCHGQGKNGEPCYYEQPPKTNLKALREGGVTLTSLLRHYMFVTEYQWQYLERDDLQRSIYVIDLDGMRFTDFVGEVVDFVKQASELSAQHYPERAGYVFVINAPIFFKIVWAVVRPFVDEDTLHKIYILRGAQEICDNMQERIDLDMIPADYGGQGVPLGESKEEKELAALVEHNNTLERGDKCPYGGPLGEPPCRFCTWKPARSY